MPLEPQTRLGPYEILAPIGAGGMGVVYKARDTRLERFVAIKILPAHIAGNPESRQRFEREARTVAALNHPYICKLFDVGEQDGTDFLVMEYLDGPTLGERLQKGPLPVAEAIRIGLQLCDALDRAHRSGVVHRDLKPANVILTADGPKLLDFGLAKTGAEVNRGLTWSATNAPTADAAVPQSLTSAGTILGTLHYMAPEQFEGQEADPRSDIFAFGAVLYEMISGRRAFDGKSPASVMSAIMSAEPPMPSRFLPAAPASLDHVLKGCLAKDPADRWHSAHDVWLQLKWSADPVGVPESIESKTKPRRWMPLLTAALGAALAVALIPAVLYFRSTGMAPAPPAEVRFEIFTPNSPDSPTLSPDGRRIAYISNAGGRSAVFVRPVNSLEAQLLPGTEGAVRLPMFWSPDSRSLGFHAITERKLKTIDVSGGPPRTLLDLGGKLFRGGTWNRNGTILVATDGPLLRIPESGGELSNATELDQSLGEIYHAAPFFLPDGRHFIYLAAGEKRENRAIYAGSLDSKARVRLMSAEPSISSTATPAYASGFLLYAFQPDNTLMARPFDADSLEFTGPAAAVAEDVIGFSVSEDGSLVYRSITASTNDQRLVWTDRRGTPGKPFGDPGVTGRIRLSPDGKRVAFHDELGPSEGDVWVYDIDRDPPVKTRLTTALGWNRQPVWSPDSSELVFASNRQATGVVGLYRKAANGAIPEQLIFPPASGWALTPRSWSLDGRWLIFERGLGTISDIWFLDFMKPQPSQYLATPYTKIQSSLSPDGRWLAYVSNEGGLQEVVVQPFPDPSGGKWKISAGRGIEPRWRRDGREIYYLGEDSQIVAVEVSPDKTFQIGKSTVLFKAPSGSSGARYDVSADGQRFLFAVPADPIAATRRSITVILNWAANLK